MVGAALLWVGWFGFNAGSNLEATGVATLAMVNTLLATAAATMSWMIFEWLLKGKPSMLGAASGSVAGLVAITPACGFVGDFSMSTQIIAQLWGVGVAVVWSGIVALVAYKIVDLIVGLRVTEDVEREGLDLNEHGEKAYHM